MIVCENCGRRNTSGTQFCSGCGWYLDWEAAAGGDPSARAETTPVQDRSPQAEREDSPEPEHLPPPTPSLAHIVSALDEGRRVAEDEQRPDVGRQLAGSRDRLAEQLFAVAVVGEFKRGKSTLVNAILQTDVCPVDADIVTAVPTIVRYGSVPSAIAQLQADDAGGAPVEEPVDVDDLVHLVSELVDPAWRARLRSVEVRLPHRLLRTGLAIVDTPGVGGLESAHGEMSLGALAQASAMIFVTDSSQELTAPELDFLREAQERCPVGVCVVTKTDLYPEWRRIADLNRSHLADAGIGMPVLSVSSFLRLRAWREADLNVESGFPALFEWIGTSVVGAAAREASEAASRDLVFAQEQLRLEVVAEQRVLDEPAESSTVVQELRRTQERTRRLSGSSSGWQQSLFDGVEDLIADVRHDLQQRIRQLTSDVEALIDESDPKESWPDVETWLQRGTVTAVTANHDLLNGRAEELATDVAEAFALDSELPMDLRLSVPTDLLDGVRLGAADNTPQGGNQKMTRLIFAGRGAVLLPWMGVNLFLISPWLVAIVPFAAVLGAGIGRKLIRDERQRQLTYRRQQAKIACRRYLDEVSFVVGKECLDSLRQTRRELRDEFTARAAVLHASAQRALSSVQRATELTADEQTARREELADRERKIETLGRGLTGARSGDVVAGAA